MYNNVMQKHPSFVEKYRSGVCWFVCEQECDCECECVYVCMFMIWLYLIYQVVPFVWLLLIL